ncbi:unnamed protein product, partial [Ectocarpus sp. 12 AP-2014]
QRRQQQQREQQPAPDTTSDGDTMPPSSRGRDGGLVSSFRPHRGNGVESSRSSAFSTALHHHAQVFNTRSRSSTATSTTLMRRGSRPTSCTGPSTTRTRTCSPPETSISRGVVGVNVEASDTIVDV